MIRRLAQRLTYANVMATLALFVALGGTSYAAVTLPRNSIGAKQIRPGSVRSSDVLDSSLQLRDFSRRARVALRGSRGPAGPAGPAGPSGSSGSQGTAGGSQGAAGGSGAAPVTLRYKTAAGTVPRAPAAEETSSASASVSCDAGQHATGGGARLDDVAETAVQDSFPGPGGTAWTVRVGNDDPAAAHGFTVFVVCVPSTVAG